LDTSNKSSDSEEDISHRESEEHIKGFEEELTQDANFSPEVREADSQEPERDSMSAAAAVAPTQGEGNSMDSLDSGDDMVERGPEDSYDPADAATLVDSEDDESSPPANGSGAAPSNTPVNQGSPVAQNGVEKNMGAGDKPAKIAAKDAKKEEKKRNKKKEDRSIEYILRALNSLETPNEKLAALCKKYADLHEEQRVLHTSFKTQQRTMTVIMREKDQLQSEHTKAIMAKSKLESLCRELQKQNKVIKDESIKRAREEDDRRKEISTQFQKTIGEIQDQMNDNTERNTKLRSENAELAVQLQNIIKQCDVREQQIDKVRKQHDLENQLAEAKLGKADLQLREERERNERNKELLISKFGEQAKKNTMLEAQVEMFKERYDDFEKLHSRSNETFQKYKTEMDKMTKRIKKLEKDGVAWKTKWEGSNKALIEMMEARNKSEKETITYVQKCKKLESLCRALQGQMHGKKPAEESTSEGTPADTPASTPSADTPASTPSAETPASMPANPPAATVPSSGSIDDIDQPSAPPASSAPPNSPEASSLQAAGAPSQPPSSDCPASSPAASSSTPPSSSSPPDTATTTAQPVVPGEREAQS